MAKDTHSAGIALGLSLIIVASMSAAARLYFEQKMEDIHAQEIHERTLAQRSGT